MTSLRQLFDLTGQVAVVTGGSRGLGVQIAEALGEFGAHLVMAARKPADLAQTVVRLQGLGMSAEAIACDLGTEAGIAALVDQAMARGRIDILVNNAGATWGAPAEDHPAEAWDKVIALNLSAVFRLSQAVAKASMLPRGAGRIVNVASIEGLKAHHPSMMGTVAYNSSKGGVISLTRALAAEWGRRGITVNALAPGYFPSKMTRGTIDAHEARLIDNPLGKLGGPDDLKGAALLLASAAGGHITGQVLTVDGGATII